ncbi:MAG: hypothetical protein LBQ31_07720 [Bacteroidales bacterium]|jgi:hypothetical protein|nr:hypothetical protein [Bacteroidales bacterium]
MKKFILLFCTLLISISVVAQTRYPVTVSSFYIKKTSPFISDYLSSPTEYINLSLIFNDLQEPSLEVYLKISIESSSVKMTTSQTFIPPLPVIIYPNEIVTLSDEELTPYFNPLNMTCSGITQEELLRGKVLPEGFYTFSVKIFERNSGKEVSGVSRQTVLIKQFEPPILRTPSISSLILTEIPEIFFSWNQPMLTELQQFNPYYNLFLYEIPSFETRPEQAISGSGILIFKSEDISDFSFRYGISELPLTVGKRYAWRVQAKTSDKKELIKNDGFSTVGWFYYGYPSDGKIILNHPSNGAIMRKTDVPLFSWKPCSSIIDNAQQVTYRLFLASIDDEAVSEYMFDEIPAQILGPYFNKASVEHTLTTPLKSGVNYAWMVRAFTGEHETGKSEVRTFRSPSLLESFLAGGDHRIIVTSLDNDDLGDLSGTGKIKVSEDGQMADIRFEHISLANAGFYYLEKGEIRTDVSAMKQIVLSPHIASNNKIIFKPDSLLITTRALRIKGDFEWKFPLECKNNGDNVTINSIWLNYDELRIIGTNPVPENMQVVLRNPENLIIDIYNNSYISFENNVWRMNFSGSITGHSSVVLQNDSVYKISFSELEQLKFNIVKPRDADNIRPVKNINFFIVPKEIVIDFCDTLSPTIKEGLAERGIYFRELDIVMKKELDVFNQVVLTSDNTENIFIGDNSLFRAHIDNYGLRLLYENSVANDTLVKFNTFPSPLDIFSVDISQSSVQKAVLKGHIKIPIISTERNFSYSIPLSNDGFQTGFLDEELEGLTFVLNKNSDEQKIEGNIKRAFFDGQTHLSLDISLYWEHIGLHCVHIPRFFVYGNTDIGFGSSGGVASLTQQQQGNINGYGVNFQGIGAGRMCSKYAFAVTGAIVFDENISGKNGPAITNAYSIEENSLLPKNCEMDEQNIETKKLTSTEGNFTMSDDGFGSPENEMNNDEWAVRQEQIEQQAATYSNALSGMAEAINSLTENNDDDANGFSFDWNGFDSGKGDTSSWNNTEVSNLTMDDIIKVLKIVAPLLGDTVEEKINKYVDVLGAINPSVEEVNKWITMFKDGTFVKFVANGIAAKVVSYVEEPLAEQADKLKKLMHDKTMQGVDTVLNKLIGLIDKASDVVFKSALAAQELSDNPVALKDKLQIILKEAIDEVMLEMKRAIDSSIETNIIPYFTNFIDTLVHARIADFLEDQISKTIQKLLTKEVKSITIKGFADDAKAHFTQIGNDFVSLFKWSNLKKMLEKTGKDIIDGYDWMGVLGKVSTELVGLAVQELLGDQLAEINKQLEASGLGGITDALANNVKIDFTKLKGGDLKNAIKFDPTFIKIESPVMDAEGYAKRVKDDPVYGDVFRAGLNVQVKVPKKFNVWATFLNGKKERTAGAGDNFNYWFVEIGCRKLGIPMSPVPLSFDGAAGRLFCRMSRSSNDMAAAYIPDYNTKFGAGMSAWFFDTPGKGAIAVFGVDFSLDILEEKKFRMTMLGDADISNVMENGNIKKSLVHGKIEAGYSNVDNIFYANARVDLKTSPLVCAGGEFRARITPDEWSISVGTRQNPLSAKLLCMDFAKVEAWTEIDNRHFDIGVHSLIDMSFKSPWIGPKGCRVRVTSTTYFEMLTDAVVYWKPLKLRDANFWLESELEFGADYDMFGSEGHFTVIGLAFGGGMTYLSRTQQEMIDWQGKEDCPSTYTSGNYSCIRGWLHGSMTILGMGFNVSVEGKKEWKG